MAPQLRTDVHEIPALRESLLTLFDGVWGFLRAKEAIAARLGYPWRAISTPFALVDGDRVVAHAGLLPLPLVVDGAPLTVGAVHAVCVAADRRGRGLGRRVLEAALADCDARYPGAVLFSEKLALYARFGFSPRDLHRHVARGATGRGHARRLDLERPDDAALWAAAMRGRGALSDSFAVLDDGRVNAFDAVLTGGGHAPLWHDERLGAVYYAETDGRRVVVDDIFAAGPFDGAALLDGLALAGDEVVFGCDLDRLGLATRIEAQPYAPRDDRLQVRGGVLAAASVAWPRYSFT